MACKISKYDTLFPCSNIIFFSCLGLILTTMPTKHPSNFINTHSFIALVDNIACIYAPGTSVMATSLPWYEPINKVIDNDYKDDVCDATDSSCLRYFL